MSETLCQYKHALGEPRKGVHSVRVLDIAIVDVALTVVAAKLIAKHFGYNFWKTLLLLFVSGIVAHRLFCVRTKIDELLFAN
jgi:hypothetical protein